MELSRGDANSIQNLSESIRIQRRLLRTGPCLYTSCNYDITTEPNSWKQYDHRPENFARLLIDHYIFYPFDDIFAIPFKNSVIFLCLKFLKYFTYPARHYAMQEDVLINFIMLVVHWIMPRDVTFMHT